MHYTIEALIQGNREVLDWYSKAVDRWATISNDERDRDPDFWAGVAFSEQISFFEQECGGREIGQEVMVVAAIARLYTTDAGFGDNLAIAKAVYQGLLKSSCSIEIHSHADAVAACYPEIAEED